VLTAAEQAPLYEKERRRLIVDDWVLSLGRNSFYEKRIPLIYER
jgi:hypothetical protein